MPGESSPRGWIEYYDFDTQRNDKLVEYTGEFYLSRDTRIMLFRTRRRWRVWKAGEKPPRPEYADQPERSTGWIDFHRIKVSVQPASEWKQMFDEARETVEESHV